MAKLIIGEKKDPKKVYRNEIKVAIKHAWYIRKHKLYKKLFLSSLILNLVQVLWHFLK